MTTKQTALAQAPKHYRSRIISLLNDCRYLLAAGLSGEARYALDKANELINAALDARIPKRLKFNSKVLRVELAYGLYYIHLINGCTVPARTVRNAESRIREALA